MTTEGPATTPPADAELVFRTTPPPALLRRRMLRQRAFWFGMLLYFGLLSGVGWWLYGALFGPLLAEGVWLVLLPAAIGVGLALAAPVLLIARTPAENARRLNETQFRLSPRGLELWRGHEYTRIVWAGFVRAEVTAASVSLVTTDDCPFVSFFKDHLDGAHADEVQAYILAHIGNSETDTLPAGIATGPEEGAAHEPPPAASHAINPAASPEAATPPVAPVRYASPAVLPRRTGLATAALVCGILAVVAGFACFPVSLPLGAAVGLVALVLGALALWSIRRAADRVGGQGLAIAGLLLGGGVVLITAVLLILVIPEITALGNVFSTVVNSLQLNSALQNYATNNAGAFPPDLQTLVDENYCPPQALLDPGSQRQPPACDFVYFAGLTTSAPGSWLVACSDPTIRQPHGGGGFLIYIDGSWEFVDGADFRKRIDEFEAAYEKARGEPPDVLPPN